MWAHKKQNGFTIVELLIVIVVIGILAAITIVAYNGIQARANDARMRSIAGQLNKAVMLWNTDSGIAPKGGWGSTVPYDGTNCADGAGGWIYQGAYTCDLEDILIGKNLIPAGLITGAPKNKTYGAGATNGRFSFMFYACSGTNRFALYWYLENPSSDDTSNLSAIEASGCTTSPRVNYGMRAAMIVQF